MQKIRLTTDGTALVHEGLIPPFLTHPDVITWGSRTFVPHQGKGEWLIYREAFAVAMVAELPEIRS